MGNVGAVLATTDGMAIGPAGAKIRVFSMHVISGGTAGIVRLYNGTSTSGSLFIDETCAAVSTGNNFNYGDEGILFPAGCYYDEVVDANVTSTLISFKVEL